MIVMTMRAMRVWLGRATPKKHPGPLADQRRALLEPPPLKLRSAGHAPIRSLFHLKGAWNMV